MMTRSLSEFSFHVDFIISFHSLYFVVAICFAIYCFLFAIAFQRDGKYERIFVMECEIDAKQRKSGNTKQ